MKWNGQQSRCSRGEGNNTSSEFLGSLRREGERNVSFVVRRMSIFIRREKNADNRRDERNAHIHRTKTIMRYCRRIYHRTAPVV